MCELLDLPPELHSLIAKYLLVSDLYAFGRTSHHMYAAINEQLRICKNREENDILDICRKFHTVTPLIPDEKSRFSLLVVIRVCAQLRKVRLHGKNKDTLNLSSHTLVDFDSLARRLLTDLPLTYVHVMGEGRELSMSNLDLFR